MQQVGFRRADRRKGGRLPAMVHKPLLPHAESAARAQQIIEFSPLSRARNGWNSMTAIHSSPATLLSRLAQSGGPSGVLHTRQRETGVRRRCLHHPHSACAQHSSMRLPARPKPVSKSGRSTLINDARTVADRARSETSNVAQGHRERGTSDRGRRDQGESWRHDHGERRSYHRDLRPLGRLRFSENALQIEPFPFVRRKNAAGRRCSAAAMFGRRYSQGRPNSITVGLFKHRDAQRKNPDPTSFCARLRL